MPITESDLPGVGKKYEIDLENGEILVIVTHNTGKREVFLKPKKGADADRLFNLSDQLARTVGTILEGAYFQPIKSEDRATTLGGGTLIEWFEVEAGSALDGETMATILDDEHIGVALVAVQRDEEVIPASQPERHVRGGDTVIAVGSKEALEAFESLLVNNGEGTGSA